MAEEYDVIIVGTGAGGGTLAHTLAPSGQKILLLERGTFLTREAGELGSGPGVCGRPLYIGRYLV